MDSSLSPKPRILLCLTGSVASIKAPDLIRKLQSFTDVRVIATQKSLYFFDPGTLGCQVYTDADEWPQRSPEIAIYQRFDPVLHIQLRDWSDLILIAPLSANTLSKLANGQCDNLLTSVVRASHKKQIVIAPAMNTQMFENPLTRQHLTILKSIYQNLLIIDPITKVLACGDFGIGAMAEPFTIAERVRDLIQIPTISEFLDENIITELESAVNIETSNRIEIEICVDSLPSALTVSKSVTRLELCSALTLGGLTPSFGFVKISRTFDVQLSILIRPRDGNFVYTDSEWEICLEEIRCIKSFLRKDDCFMIGALTSENEIDFFKIKKAIEAAKPFKVGFHRAFDFSANPIESLEKMRELGIMRILTSGQSNTALEGSQMIKELSERASELGIEIVAASGIRSSNVLELLKKTGVRSIHASASKKIDIVAKDCKKLLKLGRLDDYERNECDSDEVEKLIQIVKDYEAGLQNAENSLMSKTEKKQSNSCSFVEFDEETQSFKILQPRGKLLRNMGFWADGKQRLLPHEYVWVVGKRNGAYEKNPEHSSILGEKLCLYWYNDYDNLIKVFKYLKDRLQEEVIWTLMQFEVIMRKHNVSVDKKTSFETFETSVSSITTNKLEFDILLVWHRGVPNFKPSSPTQPNYAVIIHNSKYKSEDFFLNEHFDPKNKESTVNKLRKFCETNEALGLLNSNDLEIKLAFVNNEIVNILSIKEWDKQNFTATGFRNVNNYM